MNIKKFERFLLAENKKKEIKTTFVDFSNFLEIIYYTNVKKQKYINIQENIMICPRKKNVENLSKQ